ncbi:MULTISPECIES: hypothetical protein [unclassified Exiguobacterium]|uniref:hypothetical protein n=1 Tax=unclassified Exiguobacterium TaxID=2644629 RepID=UPI001BE82854|nr:MULTISPECIES: hypothetical protein [unclassified Exiguobacterium]
MSTIVQQKVDLTKQDFTLTGMYLADVSLYDRTSQNKQNLLFVKFVGSRSMSVSPNFLYFGDMTYEQLQGMKDGRKVDVVLKANDKSFTVEHIQDHK